MLRFCRCEACALKPLAAFSQQMKSLHLTGASQVEGFKNLLVPSEPKKWPKYNDIVYPPTPAGQPKRPAVRILN